jgi:hypothetical protein
MAAATSSRGSQMTSSNLFAEAGLTKSVTQLACVPNVTRTPPLGCLHVSRDVIEVLELALLVAGSTNQIG